MPLHDKTEMAIRAERKLCLTHISSPGPSFLASPPTKVIATRIPEGKMGLVFTYKSALPPKPWGTATDYIGMLPVKNSCSRLP